MQYYDENGELVDREEQLDDDILDDGAEPEEDDKDGHISYWVTAQNLDALPEPPSKYLGQYVYHKGREAYGRVLRYASGMYLILYAGEAAPKRVSAYVVIKRGLLRIVTEAEYTAHIPEQQQAVMAREAAAEQAAREKRDRAEETERRRKEKALAEIQADHDAERRKNAAARKAQREAEKAARDGQDSAEGEDGD